MSSKEKEILKERIKKAIKVSSQKLIEKKKALGQKLVISEDGKIRVIEPWKGYKIIICNPEKSVSLCQWSKIYAKSKYK